MVNLFNLCIDTIVVMYDAGGQTGAMGRQDRGGDVRVGGGLSITNPVLLAHQELCVWVLT